MMIEQQVIDTLEAQGAMKAGEVAEKIGVDKKEVDKAIKALVKAEKVFSPKRCFYDVVK